MSPRHGQIGAWLAQAYLACSLVSLYTGGDAPAVLGTILRLKMPEQFKNDAGETTDFGLVAKKTTDAQVAVSSCKFLPIEHYDCKNSNDYLMALSSSIDNPTHCEMVSNGNPCASIFLAMAILLSISPSLRPSSRPSSRPSANPRS